MLSIPYLLYKGKNQLINNRFTKSNLSFIFPFYNQVKEALDEFECEYEITLDYRKKHQSELLTRDDYFFYHNVLQNVPKYHYVRVLNLGNIQDSINIYHFDYEINSPELMITIYYPEVTIRNTHNKSKLLKDLYVRFHIDIKGNIINVSGTRTTLSKAEKFCSYYHSHLPRNRQHNLKFDNFCLGQGTQIYTSKVLFLDAVINNQEVKNYFSLFLHNLDSVVKYESIEGMPYIKFSDVVIPKHSLNIKVFYNLITDTRDFCTTHIYPDYIRLNFERLMSCFTKINNKLILINKELFEDICFNEYFKDYPYQLSQYKDYIKIMYNNEEIDYNDVVDINDVQNIYFYFKRKKKHLKIDEIKELDKKLVTYRISDDFLYYAIKFIVNQLKHIENERQRDFEKRFTTEITSLSF
jgi:hypothetical protein